VFLSFKQLISSSFFLGVFILALSHPASAFAAEGSSENAVRPADNPVSSSVDRAVNEAADRAGVLKSFVGSNRGELIASYDEQKAQHEILFYMGVTLLVFVLLTAGFGIAMGMLGKEVFVQHMVCAGITVFLTVAHAIVAMVWFYPF